MGAGVNIFNESDLQILLSQGPFKSEIWPWSYPFRILAIIALHKFLFCLAQSNACSIITTVHGLTQTC